MFRLTREVRFAINADADDQFRRRPANSFGGYPTLTGAGVFYTAQVTLAGELLADSQYLTNIKQIDQSVRDFLRDANLSIASTRSRPAQILRDLYGHLEQQWPTQLDSIKLSLSPFLNLSIQKPEYPMICLSQRFEFSASHRLHNPKLDDEQNRRLFGKCNNPFGHGHNYELQVTLIGTPDENGLLIDIPAFERIVAETVIDPFDHKNLNAEVPEFADQIPTVENIARTIHHLLKSKFQDRAGKLASVTVWETPKTWCEYAE